jgi:hypothetical protein
MKDLRLTGEFAEAKFRRVIAQFFALCRNFKHARSMARAVRWTCDIQDLLAAVAQAERHLQALPDGFKAEKLPLARALVDIDSLCVALTRVRAATKAVFEEAAFAIAAGDSAESAADAIAAVRTGLAALREAAPSLRAAHNQVAVPTRKGLLEKLDKLTSALENYDAGPGVMETRVMSTGMFVTRPGRLKMISSVTASSLGKTDEQ